MRLTFTKMTSVTGILLAVLALSANAIRVRWDMTTGPMVLTGVTKAQGKSAPISPAAKPSVPAQPPASGNDRGQKLFFLSGNLSGLFPGAAGQLSLTIENPHNFTIDVQTLSATVTGVDGAHSGCPAGALTVSPFQGHVIVPKGGTQTQALAVTLAGSAPDACQGAQFALSYTGSAVK